MKRTTKERTNESMKEFRHVAWWPNLCVHARKSLLTLDILLYKCNFDRSDYISGWRSPLIRETLLLLLPPQTYVNSNETKE